MMIMTMTTAVVMVPTEIEEGRRGYERKGARLLCRPPRESERLLLGTNLPSEEVAVVVAMR